MPTAIAISLDELLTHARPEGDCLIWTLAVNDRGYGVVRRGGRQHKAHRLIYELAVGPIPDGLVPDHTCRRRACVNWRHIELVTVTENNLRGEGACARNAAKDRCSNGHAFTDDNTYFHHRKNGSLRRQCRACARNRIRN